MGPAGSPLCVQTILARARGGVVFARSGERPDGSIRIRRAWLGPGTGSPCAAAAGAGPAVGAVCPDGRSSNQPPIAATVRTTTAPTARATRTGIRGAVRACASSRHNSPPGENAGAGDGASAGTYEESVSRSEGSPSAESPPRSATRQAQTRCSAAQRGPDRPGATLVPPAHDEERHDQDHHRLSGPR